MKRTGVFFLLLAIILIVLQYSYYSTELYYDRDIPSYAYNTLDILRGRGWYSSAWQSKPPGINLIILAAFSLFGESFKSIYTVALFFNLLSVYFIYLLAKSILSKETRLYFILPLFFVLFFASDAFMAHSANTEVFLAPFEIGGMLFLGLNQYFLAGLVLGLGFLIRQTGIFTFAAGILFIIALKFLDRITLKTFLKNLLNFIMAFILPLILVSFYFISLGVFEKFMNYSFIYPLQNLGRYLGVTRQKDIIFTKRIFWMRLNFEIILFGVFSLVGLFYTLVRRTRGRILVSLWSAVICLWLLRGAIYPHHYIQMIAPISCLSLLGLSDTFEGIRRLFKSKAYLRNISFAVLTIILFVPYIRLIRPVIAKTRSFYTNYGIEDRLYAAQYIKEHTGPGDKIFVWDNLNTGSIYLWSGRNSITQFSEKNVFLPVELQDYWALYVEDYRLSQRQFLLDYYQNPPKYIIVVFDYGRIIQWRNLIKTGIVSYAEWETAIKEAFESERKAFPDFFELLEKEYQLEKEIGICKIYRFIK